MAGSIPLAAVNQLLSGVPPPKRNIRNTFLLLDAVRDVIDGKGTSVENNWQFYFANAIVGKRLAATLSDVLENNTDVTLMLEQQRRIKEWKARKNPNPKFSNEQILSEVMSTMSVMDNIVAQTDRIILRLYNYNMKVSADKITEMERFIEDELSLLYSSIGISGPNVDVEQLKRVLFGAENRIHCEPPVVYRQHIDCPDPAAPPPPLLHNETIWTLQCPTVNKQYPALLLEKVREIIDTVDKYKVNNYSDAAEFIERIRGFQSIIMDIVDVFWTYLALPNLNETLLRTKPTLNSVFYTAVLDAYEHIVALAHMKNPGLYNAFFAQYTDLTEFMDAYYIVKDKKRYLALTFMDYARSCYARSLTSPATDTGRRGTNNGVVLYVNGQKAQRHNVSVSNHDLDRFVRTIQKQNITVQPNWLPGNVTI